MVSRFGTFFLLVGGVMLIIFLISDYSREPLYNLFCMGLPLLLLGFFSSAKVTNRPRPASDLV